MIWVVNSILGFIFRLATRQRIFLQASAPSHIQTIVHPIFVQLHAAVRHPEALQLQIMSCNMSGSAANAPEGTVSGTRLPRWSSSSHTLLSPFLVVTQEVLPSILPLEDGICARFLRMIQ